MQNFLKSFYAAFRCVVIRSFAVIVTCIKLFNYSDFFVCIAHICDTSIMSLLRRLHNLMVLGVF